MAIEVTITFDNARTKREVMGLLCDIVCTQLDKRLEWVGEFRKAYVFIVKDGIIPEDNEPEFGEGVFEKDISAMEKGNEQS